MTTATSRNIDKLVTALRGAVAEHGADNAFTCAEIAGNDPAPGRLVIGSLLVQHLDEVQRRLGRVVKRQVIPQERGALVFIYVGEEVQP